jgi:hypothetical protein
MEKQIKPMNPIFDFSGVPSWYVLCNNNLCPLQSDCLRFHAAAQAPETLEVASCVMPKVQNGRACRWYDKRTIVVYAAGFSHLYDRVFKKDYTTMRKTITKYLHGSKLYYEYMRGERPLSPEQQQWIIDYVKSCGYEWEVEFDSYYKGYAYHQPALINK